jgi:AraC family transcriptional regulator
MNSALNQRSHDHQSRLIIPPKSRRLRKVELSPLSESSIPPGSVFDAAGITAQYVPIASREGYGYQWVGRSHYLALHGLRLAAGETFSDASKVVHRNDLRGTLTYLPAGCRIWGWSIPKSSKQWFTALYLDPRRMEEEVVHKLQIVPSVSHVYFANPALRSTLDKLQAALLAGPARWDSMHVESLCLLSVLELCAFQREAFASADDTTGRLGPAHQQTIRQYVEANLSRDIGINDLAKLVGLSRFHFLRVFKKTTRETPYQYLLRRRVERAHDLLQKPDLSVAEVAMQVGFKDSTRFIRAFRLIKGVTPGKMRK